MPSSAYDIGYSIGRDIARAAETPQELETAYKFQFDSTYATGMTHEEEAEWLEGVRQALKEAGAGSQDKPFWKFWR